MYLYVEGLPRYTGILYVDTYETHKRTLILFKNRQVIAHGMLCNMEKLCTIMLWIEWLRFFS